MSSDFATMLKDTLNKMEERIDFCQSNPDDEGAANRMANRMVEMTTNNINNWKLFTPHIIICLLL